MTPRERAERALWAARRCASHRWLISLDETAVLREANAAQARWRTGRPRSALDGMLVAVKDQLHVAGVPTTCGTRFIVENAVHDAEAVARLRAAGAIPFGKANLYELALGPSGHNPHHGAARNPWDPARDTGGSSSGSAALVAAGVVPLALGTDLGGSLRIPAAWCGVAALKPTFGRIPIDGLVPIAPSLEHVGPIGRGVEEVRLAYSALTGTEANLGSPRPVRIGLCAAWWAKAEGETASVAEAALRGLRGATVRAIALPALERPLAVGSLITSIEAAQALAWTRARRGLLGPAVRVPLAVGRALTAADQIRLYRARAQLCREIEAVFGEVDVIATPTVASTATPYRDEGQVDELDEAEVSRRIAFTLPFNLTGMPAVQVPCGLDGAGLPVGLQIAAPFGGDLLVLNVAAAVEAASHGRWRAAPEIVAPRLGLSLR